MSARSKKWFKGFVILALIFLVAFLTLAGLAYQKQDDLVQEAIETLNQDFKGRFTIADSHISPFNNFPYISLDFEEVEIYDSKADTAERLAYIKDFYVGFDLISIIQGDFEVKKIKLSDGFIKLIQHVDGSFNEQIKDLAIGFRFKSSAQAFTESPNLPLGEFFIDSLNAQLTNYPHKLHDFHADIIIDSTDFNVIDFTGMLDQSDFHFNGRLANYDL